MYKSRRNPTAITAISKRLKDNISRQVFLRDIQCVNRDTGDTFDRTPPGTDVIGIITFLLYPSLAVFAMLLFTDYFKRQIFSIFPFILSLPAGAAAENVSPAVSDSTAKSDKYNSDRTMSYCRQWRKQESVLPLHSHIFQKVPSESDLRFA